MRQGSEMNKGKADKKIKKEIIYEAFKKANINLEELLITV